MIFGSVCSGIEAASVAWEPLGWRAAFLSEIEAFPRAVLAHRFPSVPLHGDFTTIEAGQYEPIDLLVGGTPCQSFSVAGLRGGLGDDRGNLALEYLRLADRLRPRWLAWENVPGVLSSSGGRDFGSILGGLVELGYGFAYRVLDAQYVRVDGLERAVPQRRRRVFVVGYLGDWRRAAAVLFERESLSGHPPPRREAGQGASAGAGLGFGGGRQSGPSDVATALTALTALTAHGRRQDWEVETFVTDWPATVAPTLGTAWADRHPGSSNQDFIAQKGGLFVPDTIAFDTTQITSAANRSNPKPGDPRHPLAAGAHPPAIAFQERGRDGGRSLESQEGVAYALTSPNGGGRTQERCIAYGISSDAIDRSGEGDGSAAQRAGLGIVEGCSPSLRSRANNSVATPYAVRRLTPLECERLMGLPDGWTAIPMQKRNRDAETAEMVEYFRRTGQDEAIRLGLHMAADGPRYKALGNSMAVNVMRWIARRIAMVEAISDRRTA